MGKDPHIELEEWKERLLRGGRTRKRGPRRNWLEEPEAHELKQARQRAYVEQANAKMGLDDYLKWGSLEGGELGPEQLAALAGISLRDKWGSLDCLRLRRMLGKQRVPKALIDMGQEHSWLTEWGEEPTHWVMAMTLRHWQESLAAFAKDKEGLGAQQAKAELGRQLGLIAARPIKQRDDFWKVHREQAIRFRQPFLEEFTYWQGRHSQDCYEDEFAHGLGELRVRQLSGVTSVMWKNVTDPKRRRVLARRQITVLSLNNAALLGAWAGGCGVVMQGGKLKDHEDIGHAIWQAGGKVFHTGDDIKRMAGVWRDDAVLGEALAKIDARRRKAYPLFNRTAVVLGQMEKLYAKDPKGAEALRISFAKELTAAFRPTIAMEGDDV